MVGVRIFEPRETILITRSREKRINAQRKAFPTPRIPQRVTARVSLLFVLSILALAKASN